MTQPSSAADRLEVRFEPALGAVSFGLTRLLFPARMIADHIGVSTNRVMFWLTPWRRTDDHLPLSHIAEVIHDRGFFWDAISVESSGGLNPLRVRGVRNSASALFRRARARVDQPVRGRAAAAVAKAIRIILPRDSGEGGPREARWKGRGTHSEELRLKKRTGAQVR